jgi:hypothetical protein
MEFVNNNNKNRILCVHYYLFNRHSIHSSVDLEELASRAIIETTSCTDISQMWRWWAEHAWTLLEPTPTHPAWDWFVLNTIYYYTVVFEGVGEAKSVVSIILDERTLTRHFLCFLLFVTSPNYFWAVSVILLVADWPISLNNSQTCGKVCPKCGQHGSGI